MNLNRHKNFKNKGSRATKQQFYLPKINPLQQDDQKELNIPQSLSPVVNRIKTLNDFSLSTKYQPFHINPSEEKPKKAKGTLRSAPFSRNKDISIREKRKASASNPQDSSKERLFNSDVLKIKGKSQSQANLHQLNIKSPSATFRITEKQENNLTPSELNQSSFSGLNGQSKIVSFNDQPFEYINEREEDLGSGTPNIKRTLSSKWNGATSNNQLLPILEGTSKKKKKNTEDQMRFSVTRNSLSRESNALQQNLIFTGTHQPQRTRENRIDEEDFEKMKGERDQFMKENEKLKCNLKEITEKKNNQIEKLTYENNRLKFQLESMHKEQQRQLKFEQKRLNTFQQEIKKEKNSLEMKTIFKELQILQDSQYNELILQLNQGFEQIKNYANESSNENGIDEICTQFEQLKLFVKDVQKKQSQNIQLETFGAKLRFFPSSLIKFEHSQRLGKGGFGTVFRVKVGDEEMASKVFEYDLEKDFSSLGERLEMLFNEVKILTLVNLLNDKHFVRLHGISFEVRHHAMSGKYQFIFAIFMELVAQIERDRFIITDLKQFIFHHFKEEDYTTQMLKIGAQIAEGVKVLHQNNIVHSDLKPQNILLDHNHDIKIIDFGTSKLNFDLETHDTNLLGFTPRYCPLEHFDLEKLTPTTDVWSFGCLLFEMATSQQPWKGFKKTFDVRKALEDKQSMWSHYASLPGSHPQSVNTDIVQLIEKCTSYEHRPHPSYINQKIQIIQEQMNSK